MDTQNKHEYMVGGSIESVRKLAFDKPSWEEKVDEFVRDVCKIQPRPKSYVREKTLALLASIEQEAVERTREEVLRLVAKKVVHVQDIGQMVRVEDLLAHLSPN